MEKKLEQDIFDFRTRLFLTPAHTWADPENPGPNDRQHRFEIRTRFHDGLTAPYFYVNWNRIATRNLRGQHKKVITRYKNAEAYIPYYLEARVQALRWLEERMDKNADISKPALSIHALRHFTLDIHTVAAAARDYLRLDFITKLNDWYARHLMPPRERIAQGISLPLQNITITSTHITAYLYPEGCQSTLHALLDRITTLEEGAFARLAPCHPNLGRGQTLAQLNFGKTCKITSIDEQSGEVHLSILSDRGDNFFRLASNGARNDDPQHFDFATLDEGVSDFTSPRVESQLSRTHTCPAYD